MSRLAKPGIFVGTPRSASGEPAVTADKSVTLSPQRGAFEAMALQTEGRPSDGPERLARSRPTRFRNPMSPPV